MGQYIIMSFDITNIMHKLVFYQIILGIFTINFIYIFFALKIAGYNTFFRQKMTKFEVINNPNDEVVYNRRDCAGKRLYAA